MTLSVPSTSSQATKSRHFLTGVDVDETRKRIEKEGCFLVPNAFDAPFCRSIIEWVDRFTPDARTEVHYGGSELRIYDAERKNEALRDFFERCHETLAYLFGSPGKPETLLAIRNRAVDPSDQSLEIGRWHIDSFSKQMKIFLFLTDTTERSGPFEFIPGSHARGFKLRMLCRGKYVKPSNLWSKRRAYQSIPESEIEKLFQSGRRATPVICRAGTIMIVNTSAIHRARPCLEGSRYALTAYYL